LVGGWGDAVAAGCRPCVSVLSASVVGVIGVLGGGVGSGAAADPWWSGPVSPGGEAWSLNHLEICQALVPPHFLWSALAAILIPGTTTRSYTRSTIQEARGVAIKGTMNMVMTARQSKGGPGQRP
jgi:hypothetical protein